MAATSDIFLILILTISLLTIFLHKFLTKKSNFPTNWPILGMLPSILKNAHRIHDFATEVLTESHGTFVFAGPWLCNMDMVVTCDPSNIHHIFSRNFPNYPKGEEFNKIFDVLGDGIFNADFELWELHRRTTLSFMTHADFYTSLEDSVRRKIELGLLPVLHRHSSPELGPPSPDLDLQDVFQRFTFDSICQLLLGYDPKGLSLEFPYIACEKAFNDAIDALLHRHVLPENVWKAQKWLGIGRERKLREAWKSFDDFIYAHLPAGDGNNNTDNNLLAAFAKGFREKNGAGAGADSVRTFLRDTVLSLMFAGRDTTSTCLTWLFYLLAKNPNSITKLRKEIEGLLHGEKFRVFSVEETRKLVYLHGALCESLRLFPPVALEHKTPTKPDNLPSGHFIREKTRVIVSFYSTGRLESVWGKDCLEFRPERWISGRGGVKHEPSYKFPAFNAGPRTCLGKEMAFVQMKMVASAIIYHYDVEIVEGHKVEPRDSIILQAKDGLRVRLLEIRNV